MLDIIDPSARWPNCLTRLLRRLRPRELDGAEVSERNQSTGHLEVLHDPFGVLTAKRGGRGEQLGYFLVSGKVLDYSRSFCVGRRGDRDANGVSRFEGNTGEVNGIGGPPFVPSCRIQINPDELAQSQAFKSIQTCSPRYVTVLPWTKKSTPVCKIAV